ncbi:helix-turn-helix domain-containing protein [Roseateles sp.]|uniref:helix-turn-helix domain-containing protein n=1 Tax=Roseateles sp. TaxID=1971397 RepID=UPI0039527AA6
MPPLAESTAPASAEVAEEAGASLTVEAPPAPEASEPASKYARSGLTDAARQLIEARLHARMAQTRDFLESDLTLAQLAERIGTSTQLLSQVLNDGLGLNFFDYVNGLRVAEVQRLLADPARAKTPVLDLAFEAGFNSKSTFNAVFRDRTGTTPSVWRRQAAQPFGH